MRGTLFFLNLISIYNNGLYINGRHDVSRSPESHSDSKKPASLVLAGFFYGGDTFASAVIRPYNLSIPLCSVVNSGSIT